MGNHKISLDEAIKSYVVLLDTCFAMSDSFEAFLNEYHNVLITNPIKVPTVVIGELENRAKRPHPTKPDAQEKAKRALTFLDQCLKDKIIEVRGDQSDKRIPKLPGAADAVFVKVVAMHIATTPILVLTFDGKLTEQLLTFKTQENYATKPLLIARINQGGKLCVKRTDSPQQTIAYPSHERSSTTHLPRAAANPFKIANQVAPNLDTLIPVKTKIQEGSVLKTPSGQSITLGKEIARGGEGIVYAIENSTNVCKIYHDKDLTQGRKEKIELMLTRSVPDTQICYPRAAILDATGTFRGFTMPRATGEPIGKGLFHTSFAKTHPQWNRKHSAQLALTILAKIDDLHRLNILIGDINPMNILVTNEKTVHFVDCDSYQVEGYPCPVGTPLFTAPEIQGQNFKNFLRTIDHELFAVATLLFMIFMPGRSPYGHEGGEGVAENIKEGHFPYAHRNKETGEQHGSDRVPKGKWRFIWSHLAVLKGAFVDSFHITRRGKPRKPVFQWQKSVSKYLSILNEQGFIGPQQRAGIDISLFPENLCRKEENGQLTREFLPDGKTD